MARTHVRRVETDPTAIPRVLNGPRAQAYLQNIAEELNALALRFFMLQQRGRAAPPIFYITRFKIRRVRKPNGIDAYEAYNDDPVALWVEFGAHARGKTFVLRYRPYGKAQANIGGFG